MPNALDVTRRAILAAGAALPASALASTALAQVDPISGMTVINALGSLDNPNARGASGQEGRRPLRLDARALADARASGVTAVNWTIGYVMGDDDPFQASVSDIALYDRMIAEQSGHLLKVRTVADIDQARRENKVGIIYGFQNGEMLHDDLDRVDIFADLGVRIVQLTYNLANSLGDGAMAPENRGLTPFGRAAVERLNDRNIIVDLSHSGQQTCLDAIEVSRRPISINHTGCRALVDLPRNKTDEELRGVAESGGFLGIYFMPFLNLSGHASAEDVVAHIEHAVNICGEDHVGIGTDGSVTQIDDLDAYAARLAEENARRRAAGVAAPGERADTYPFVVDLRGVDQFRRLARLLAQRGHSTARIEKIMGGAFLRHARDIWGG